jgi:hypothetical protein
MRTIGVFTIALSLTCPAWTTDKGMEEKRLTRAIQAPSRLFVEALLESQLRMRIHRSLE